MPEPQTPVPGADPGVPDPDRLDSWKDIAAYLGREVRTVQLWEKNEGLPVHRHLHARQGTVYAFRSELEAWRRTRASLPEPVPESAPDPARPTPAPASRRTILLAALALLIVAAASGIYLWKTRSSSASAAPHAVAVLPFVDMSPNKDQEYFSDGLTEEIIDALSRVPNLHVVARTSAFAYKGKAADIRTIAQQLNVDAVLEGSVRKSGDQLRITAQLNRASDGFHYWSREYDRPLQDVFGVQREISQAIASQLRAGQVAQHQPTQDLEAYRLYEEGKFFFNQFTEDSFHKAIDRYRQAIARDPQFALAYAGLADAYSYLSEIGLTSPAEVSPKAREAAEHAVSLDPSSGEAHTSLGLVKLDYDWDRPAAETEFLRAAELNPSSSWIHHWLGHLRESQGRLDDAMTEFRAAIQLDPLSEPLRWDLAADLEAAHRVPEAAAMLDQARELFPDNPAYLMNRIALAIRSNDLPGAESRLKTLTANFPHMDTLAPAMLFSLTGALAAKQGRRADAQAALRKLEDLHRKQFIDGASGLQVCLALEDHDCALRWLTRLHDERSPNFVYLPLYERDRLPLVPESPKLFSQIR